jgi:hypothetical protein
MAFFIDFVLLGLLVIGLTAFLGSIGRIIVRSFVRGKADLFIQQNLLIKKGWKKVGGRQ